MESFVPAMQVQFVGNGDFESDLEILLECCTLSLKDKGNTSPECYALIERNPSKALPPPAKSTTARLSANSASALTCTWNETLRQKFNTDLPNQAFTISFFSNAKKANSFVFEGRAQFSTDDGIGTKKGSQILPVTIGTTQIGTVQVTISTCTCRRKGMEQGETKVRLHSKCI
jgi:hypothetical protein